MKRQDHTVDPFSHDVAALEVELSKLVSRIHLLRQRTEQLSTLRDEEGHAAARIAVLERVLDFERVAAHVRSAVARTELVEEPVPHLVASTLLPPDVFQAVLEAIPARVFFEGDAVQGQEMRVPPRLAPTCAIVTWMFLNDIVLRTLSDIVVARFVEPLTAHTRERFPSLPPFRDWGVEITLSQARIVRRTPGYAGGASTVRPWDLLNGIVSLARERDTEEHGSRLDGMVFPFRANSALIHLGPAEAHAYASIPPDAPSDLERYTYEFGIGPTRDARRTLTAVMAHMNGKDRCLSSP